MSAMTVPPSPEISAAELRAYVLMQVERLEDATGAQRETQRPTVEEELADPVRRRAALEIRVATLEGRAALGGR